MLPKHFIITLICHNERSCFMMFFNEPFCNCMYRTCKCKSMNCIFVLKHNMCTLLPTTISHELILLTTILLKLFTLILNVTHFLFILKFVKMKYSALFFYCFSVMKSFPSKCSVVGHRMCVFLSLATVFVLGNV